MVPSAFVRTAMRTAGWWLQLLESVKPLAGSKTTKRRELAGMVRSMDEGVGNVSAALTASGIMEDTLIIFCGLL